MNRVWVALWLLGAGSSFCLAADRPIDAARSKIIIHVGKSGLLSAASHEHQVAAPITEGAIDDSGSGHVWFVVDAKEMKVLAEKDQNAVETEMQQNVLESERFPEIRFDSTTVKKLEENKWTVTGNLALHGQTHAVTVDVHREAAGYGGEARIRQTQFGIQPPSAAGGAVKAKDELKIEFLIVPAS